MPRILICNESIGYGGLASYTLSLIRSYKHIGWEVGLVTTHSAEGCNGDIDTMVSYILDLSSCGNFLNKLKRLIRFSINFNPDILLLNNCSLAHYMLPFLGSRIKPVVVLHSNAQFIYRTASLFSNRVFRWVAPTKALKDEFLRYISPAFNNRVKIIQHGVDDSKFRYIEKTTNPTKIVTIGFLGFNKGVDLLPDIYKRIFDANNNVRFFIVGDGPDYEKLKNQVTSSQLPVTLTGNVPNGNLPEILADSDILLLPTRVEGFGLAIVEAMMCGVVPVISNLAGVTDTIVKDKVSGLLVPVNDTEGFANAVISLIHNKEIFYNLSKTARERAINNYSLNTMVDNYTALFNESDDRIVQKTANLLTWTVETLKTLLIREPDGSIPLIRRLINLFIVLRKKISVK